MIELKQASMSDMDKVLNVLNGALHKKHMYADHAWGSGTFTADEMTPDVVAGNLYLAYEDGYVVGSVVVQTADQNVWEEQGLDRLALYVHKLASLKKGVGTHMLQCVEQMARDSGKACVRLDCGYENENLCNYYLRHGFYIVRRRGGELKSALFEKDLD